MKIGLDPVRRCTCGKAGIKNIRKAPYHQCKKCGPVKYLKTESPWWHVRFGSISVEIFTPISKGSHAA